VQDSRIIHTTPKSDFSKKSDFFALTFLDSPKFEKSDFSKKSEIEALIFRWYGSGVVKRRFLWFSKVDPIFVPPNKNNKLRIGFPLTIHKSRLKFLRAKTLGAITIHNSQFSSAQYGSFRYPALDINFKFSQSSGIGIL
jgi:hypothetical protein